MKSILLKGMDRSYKSNKLLHKSILDKIHINNINNKKLIKSKLLFQRKTSLAKDIFIPLSIHYKKINDNLINNKKPYCITESNVTIDAKKDINFKKIISLPKIKENNKYLSKKDIYLGSNKFSINLNSASGNSCGKILLEKNNDNIQQQYPIVKKLFLKEISFNKSKIEKRGRTIGQLLRYKKNYNLIKKENNLNMGDIIISNDFLIITSVC